MNSIFVFLIGLCVGSFLNVVIDRPFQKRSVTRGRSSCDFCHHTLEWYDLVPVFSFIFLHAACRYCHKKLSLQYPLVEALTAVFFVLIYFFYPHTSINNYIVLLSLFLMTASGIVLFVTDAKYQTLPDSATLIFGLGALLFALFTPLETLFFRFGIGLIAAIPFFLISFLSRGRAMGFGDVKLTFVLGFFLGFPKILIALYVAFLTGAVWAIILILRRKKKFHGGTIAFGPFLLLGTVVAFTWGSILWEYLKILLGF